MMITMAGISAVILVILAVMIFLRMKRYIIYPENCEENINLEAALLKSPGQISEQLVKRVREGGTDAVSHVLIVWPKLAMETRNQIYEIWESEGLIRRIVDDLSSKDDVRRSEAVQTLISLKDKRILPLLAEALENPTKFLPARVAEIFIAIGADASEYLTGILPGLPERTKGLTIDILGEIADPHAVSSLVRELEGESAELRKKASEALGEIGSPEAGNSLITALKDQDWGVRSRAAKALGQIGFPEAAPALKEALADEAWWVQVNAREALGKIIVSVEEKNA